MTYALQSTNSGSAAILPVPKTGSERKLMYNNEGGALGCIITAFQAGLPDVFASMDQYWPVYQKM